MARDTLLVELLTEELPPKALPLLGEVFGNKVFNGLIQHHLKLREPVDMRWFATPRRLAVTVKDVLAEAPAREVTEKLMPVSVAVDAEGRPTAALLKKLDAKGIAHEEFPKFERRLDGKAEALFYTAAVPGAKLAEVLAGIVQEAVRALPIPKVMRWGEGEAQFVRPVHKLVMLHGPDVVPGTVLDLQAGRTTMGHRFMSRGELELATAEAYEATLLAEGKVIPDFAERRSAIEKQLVREAEGQGASLGQYADLLDEVTALVEHPTVYAGEFDPGFLAVPQECLILTMRANQKYFPLFDAAGRLQNRFLIVSNMHLADPANVIAGNQRVVRPRLSDARFFFEQDRKAGLTTRVIKLDSVVYATKLGAEEHLAHRAALLCKADLLTDMVGEFPELQGTMGRYYALHEGALPVVADAVEQHYRPRFAGDALPDSNVGRALALADKLDALVGFFGIGQIPTGDKDPFGLRRAALGVLRILMETPLPLDLAGLIQETAASFPPRMLTNAVDGPLFEFVLERLRNLLREAGHAQAAVDAVLALKPSRIDLVVPKLEAVVAFQALPEAEALAAANKRIVNILKKAEGDLPEPDVALLAEDAEKALFHAMVDIAPLARSHFANEDYTDALRVLAGLRGAVDRFFDEVMVMAEEPLIRTNRLALLQQLAGLMNQVADISRLSAAT